MHSKFRKDIMCLVPSGLFIKRNLKNQTAGLSRPEPINHNVIVFASKAFRDPSGS